MTTPLRGPLKRQLAIGKEAYILTITPDGFKLVPKGKRKGYEMSWTSLVSGDAALAVALHASLGLSKAAEATHKTSVDKKPPEKKATEKTLAVKKPTAKKTTISKRGGK